MPLRRQVPTLERPKVGKSLLLPIHGILAVIGNVRHPCRTRVSKFYLTQGSMESGYEILKEIIHSTKLKQTSPLILPLDQIELVQNEISKVSTAIIDPDFSKMQSIVVSDPADPTKLLVVVNVAALGRRNLELVRMIPVPYFESGTAYEIILDYHTIVLDQNAHTFSILTEQEEYDCLFNRCYVGSSCRSRSRVSCAVFNLAAIAFLTTCKRELCGLWQSTLNS